MLLTFEEVIKVDVVLAGVQLLSTPSQREAFVKATGVEVSQAVVEVELGSDVLGISPKSLLVLNRDRVFLELGPHRSIIRKDYPDTPSDLEKLLDIVVLAVKCSDIEVQTLQAYGCNLDAVYSLPSKQQASLYVAQQVFALPRLKESTHTIVNGEAKLGLRTEDNQLWNLVIAPRLNHPTTNKLFVSCNPHVIGESLPTRKDLRKLLNTGWGLIHDIADILGME